MGWRKGKCAYDMQDVHTLYLSLAAFPQRHRKDDDGDDLKPLAMLQKTSGSPEAPSKRDPVRRYQNPGVWNHGC